MERLKFQQQQNLGQRFGSSIIQLSPWWLSKGDGSVLVDFLFIVTPNVEVCNCSMFCCSLLCVHSSFAIILMGKRELVALLSLSPWCLVMIVWFFLAVPWVCLRFVIVVFPDHTHLLFLTTRTPQNLVTFLFFLFFLSLMFKLYLLIY